MKICSKCRIEKEDTEFYKRKTGLQSYCKVCLLEATKKDYRENNRKQIFIERCNKRLLIFRKMVDYVKISNPCMICGEKDIVCLDFHHVNGDGKGNFVSYWQRAKSKLKLINEMKKCIVVCSNCHRKIHFSNLIYDKDVRCIVNEQEIMNIWECSSTDRTGHF